MMYDELVKRLRECTAEQNGEKTLWHQAADAIEELNKRCEEAYSNGLLEGGIAQRAEDAKWMPHWIPVTERLPEEEEVVLVWGGASVYTAKRHNKYGELMWWKLNSRWHYCNPTHWMPLPEPPESEGE